MCCGEWPLPLTDDDLYGLAGDFVKVVEPHTEADPAALLLQFLAYYGHMIGRGAYWQIEDSQHHLNLFVDLVGKTGISRKGTAERRVRKTYNRVCDKHPVPQTSQEDNPWSIRRQSGLSSGEGLIWAVRDHSDDGPGVTDKRLLVIEEEFASALKVMKRQGNTLSPVIRTAWDDGNLQILTKNCPAKATDAHISIVGHITKHELRSHLDETDMANGLANRFLFLCVKRSKSLPLGGRVPDEAMNPIVDRLEEAIQFGSDAGEIGLDDGARDLWVELYDELSEERRGLVGAVLSRAAPQVRRLAAIYACLDMSNVVRREHLLAGLALWNYCEQSVYHIFGNRTGDLIADKIMKALRKSANGLSRTDISRLFSGNVNADRIDTALSLLKDINLAKQRKHASSGGRPSERWYTE